MNRYAIVFFLPQEHKKTLWSLPEPSSIVNLSKGSRISYVLQYYPHGKNEWQRLASIKVQLQNRFPKIVFQDHEPFDGITGRIYKTSELGKHFTDSIAFPPAFYQGETMEILTRHAKRLYFKKMLHFEHLVYVSHQIAEYGESDITKRRPWQEGIKQIMKRADSAYQFALEHCNEWNIELSPKERHEVLSQSALKSAQVKKEKARPKIAQAKKMRKEGIKLKDIAIALDVSLSTVKNYLKQ